MIGIRAGTRRIHRAAGIAVLLLAVGALAQDAPTARIEATPTEATVGDPIDVTLTVHLPAGTELLAEELGPKLGPFSVLAGSWTGPQAADGGSRWTWSGSLGAYETGELEIPAIAVSIQDGQQTARVSTEPLTISIVSVLSDAEGEGAELADLKAPASLDADLAPVWTALGILGLLLLGSLVAWWVHRRYGHKLAAVEIDDDPFRRVPPHVWVYAELQQLLERRLPEQGKIDLFYSELSRILKRYLGGRYRVGLMEETTSEVRPTLEQAGAPARSIDATVTLLDGCDRVKFARAAPGPDDWKSAVEEIYRIVDATRPAEVEQEAAAGRGAA